MTDVFISYAHEDHAYVRRMAPALEAEGFTVWWDHTIPPGKTWDEVIAKGIADARCCIVLWSQSSVVSDWVKEEATIAKDHRKFIPVQIDNSEPPVGFRRIQAAHLQNWTGNVNEPQWQMLVREIRSVISTSRAGGGASPSRDHAPRSYQSAAPAPRTAPPVAMFAIAGAIALAAVVGFVALRSPSTSADITPAPPPAQAQVETPVGEAGQLERLQRERDAALETAGQLERLQRERDAALETARLQREENERLRIARERAAAEQAQIERAATNERTLDATLTGGAWSLRRQFTHGPRPPRPWAEVPASFRFYADGTFADSGEGGSWTRNGNQVTFQFSSGIRTRYVGRMSGRVITGTFTNSEGESGNFELYRN